MSTTEQVEESLAQQVTRHELLKSILKSIAELRKTDEDGADWVLEQISEG
jgi:hypothetical protein